MPRELSKCREWEKERRDRQNKCINALGKLLPCYDPSLSLSKITILEKAASYIEELQQKVKDLLSPESVEKVQQQEIKKLWDRIKKLLLRNEQLTILLKDAGIAVPSEYGKIKKFKKSLLWSNRISAEQVKILSKKESEKENILERCKNQTKPKLKHKIIKPTNCKSKRSACKQNEKKKVRKPKKGVPKITSSKCLILVSQPSFTNAPTYIITNAPSVKNVVQNPGSITSVVTSSALLTTPLVTSTISKVSTKGNTPLSSLGPGTLILANGSVVPVLPQSAFVPQNRTIITNPTPILVHPQQSKSAVIVVATTPSTITKSSVANSLSVASTLAKCTKALPHLKPKMCTKTVQINKVPIPALSSTFSSVHSVLVSHKTPKNVKAKDTVIKNKTCVTNDVQTSESPAVVSAASQINPDNCLKRKAQVENDQHSENKRQKTNAVSEGSEKSANENNTEEDSKNTSNYSIDSLCREKVSSQTKEQEPNNQTTSSSVAEVVDTSTVNNVKSDSTKTDSNCGIPTNKSGAEVLADNGNQVKKSAESKKDVNQTPEKSVRSPVIPESVLKEIESHHLEKTDVAKESDKTKEISQKPSELNLPHSDFSSDIFASLQVPNSGHNPESTSPTAAFLDAFPITLTGVKVTEVMDEDNSDSQQGTHTLLQIGTMTPTKPTQSSSDSLTPNLLNLDSFSFFSSKDICSSLYSGFDTFNSTSYCTTTSSVSTSIVSASNATTSVESRREAVAKCEKDKGAHDNTFAPKDGDFDTDLKRCDNTPSEVRTVPQKHSSKPEIISSEKSKQNPALPLSDINHLSQSTTLNEYDPFSSNMYHSYNTSKLSQSSSLSKSSSNKPSYSLSSVKPNYTVTQCNTFNPFTDVKSSCVSTYPNVSKVTMDPLYSNNSSYGYSTYQPENNFCQYPHVSNRNGQKGESKPYYGAGYEIGSSSTNNRKYENNFGSNYCQISNTQNQKFNNHVNKNKEINTPPKTLVNWMTTPDPKQQVINSDYSFPPFFNKDSDSSYPSSSFGSNTQTSYFNSTTYSTAELTYTLSDPKKSLDFPVMHTNTFQRNELEDNQFSWSPTKLPHVLEPQTSFVTPTLPTLVGDLALGNTQAHFSDQKHDSSKSPRSKDTRRNKMPPYENQGNFFSVSQLVEHNKNDIVPARTNNRRNSGSRSTKATVAQKPAVKRSHKDVKETHSFGSHGSNNKMGDPTTKTQPRQPHNANNNNYSMTNNSNAPEWLTDSSRTAKNLPSSYSAEALISHQPTVNNSIQRHRNKEGQSQNNYPPVTKPLSVPFLAENMLPYFPSVDLQQENSFSQQSQSYQNSNFASNFSSSIQSNTYSTNSLIGSVSAMTTSYLPTTNFMPDLTDYNTAIPDNLNLFPSHSNRTADGKVYSKTSSNKVPELGITSSRGEERKNAVVTSNTCGSSAASMNMFSKKTRRKHSNESNMPGFDLPFLPVPSAINSPILPDDFHTNFLSAPTPQLYSCKNPLYAKQTNELSSGSLLPLPHATSSKSSMSHPDISPSINSAGTSLTNFNLSTIFPEINKNSATLPDVYPDQARSRDYGIQRNYINSSQVTFDNKPASYVNSNVHPFTNS